MKENCKIGCILLAAGYAARFGENKLLAAVNGRSLIARALAAAPQEIFYKRVLVTQYPEIAALGEEVGFTTRMNDKPELGQSHSIHLGMDALPEAAGLLFLVADQPYLRAETVREMVALFHQSPASIVVPMHAGKRGNPVLFPKAAFTALRALSGDVGGRGVIRAFENLVLPYEVQDARELQDVDTAADLMQLS